MMYPFGFAFVLLQATVLAVIGFFVLFAASRSQGLLKHFGNVLGCWILAITLVALLAFAAAPLFGVRPYSVGMIHNGWARGVPDPLRQPPRLPASNQPATPTP